MKILFYTSLSRYGNKPVGGAEISMQFIAEKMAKFNDGIFFVAFDIPGIPHSKKQKINGVSVYNFKHLILPSRINQFLKYRLAYVKLLQHQRRKFIARIVKKEKIDIIYSYDATKDIPDILKAREIYKLKVKVVRRAAGLFWSYLLDCGKITKIKVEWALNSVDAVNYLTPTSKTYFIQAVKRYGIQLVPKKEIMLDIGVNLELFRYCWKPKKDKVFKIISVARFSSYQKRQDMLVESLSLVKNKDFILHFIGVGDKFERIKFLCHKLGVSERVVFHGYLSQEQIVKMLSESDLFVLPTDYEGLPKSLLEAMAVGVPCLVSDVTPLNNYVQDGINGYLAENTPEKWANKIDDIYQKQDQFPDVSLRGREFVFQNYNADENAVKYQEAFKKMLEN